MVDLWAQAAERASSSSEDAQSLMFQMVRLLNKAIYIVPFTLAGDSAFPLNNKKKMVFLQVQDQLDDMEAHDDADNESPMRWAARLKDHIIDKVGASGSVLPLCCGLPSRCIAGCTITFFYQRVAVPCVR